MSEEKKDEFHRYVAAPIKDVFWGTLKDAITLRIKRGGNWVDDVIKGFELAKEEMEAEGLLTDETTFEELAHYAGSYIRIVIRDEACIERTGETWLSMYWKERQKNKGRKVEDVWK